VKTQAAAAPAYCVQSANNPCVVVLQNLDLSQNQLTGDISVLALMPFLARARVSENRLTGSLPLHMASSFLQVKSCLNPIRNLCFSSEMSSLRWKYKLRNV